MKSKEYEQIYKTIYDIRKEVLKNKKRIEIGLQEMINEKQLIKEKREYVFSLRRRLKELQQRNEKYYESIKDKIKYKEQADQLDEIASYFHEENKRYENNPNLNAQSLSREKELEEVGIKIDEIISLINAEYTYSSDDYLQQHKQLNKINASIDREIELLKLLKVDQFRYADNFDIILDEFSNKFIPSERHDFESFQTLYTNQSDISDVEIQTVDADIQIPPPLTDKDMTSDIVDVIRDCKEKSKTIKYEYLVQHQELSKMIEALKNRPINFQDNSVIENCLQHRLQIMRTIGPIRAIQLPPQIANKDLKYHPLTEIFSKFDSFFAEIKKYKEMRKYNQQPQLEIPPFQIPNEPRCVRESTHSEELVKFAEDLKSIIDQTKRMIPIEWSKSITQTYRSLLNLKRYEYSPPTSKFLIPEFNHTIEAKNEDIQFDKSFIDQFKETFARKFPDSLSKSLDVKRVALEIPNDEEENDNDSTDNTKTEENLLFDMPIESSKNSLNRIKATNVILRDIVRQPKTAVPHLQMPKPPVVNQPNIDTNSLIEKVQEVLSPKQQSIRFFKNEIVRLNAKIEKLTNQSIEKDEEEEDDDNSETQKSIEDETNELNRNIDLSKEKYNNSEELLRELCEKRERMKHENEIIKRMIDENEITHEMVSEVENEYKTKKENLQQRMDAWNELLEIQSELRANS